MSEAPARISATPLNASSVLFWVSTLTGAFTAVLRWSFSVMVVSKRRVRYGNSRHRAYLYSVTTCIRFMLLCVASSHSHQTWRLRTCLDRLRLIVNQGSCHCNEDHFQTSPFSEYIRIRPHWKTSLTDDNDSRDSDNFWRTSCWRRQCLRMDDNVKVNVWTDYRNCSHWH